MNEARSLIDRDAAAALIEPLTEIVIRAGAAILAINRSAMRIDGKIDGSPVTEADLAADRIIAEGLAQLAPAIPSLSEERVDKDAPPYKESFFLVDPLDGTKEFVARNGEFTVNIALIEGGVPVLGIVHLPALDETYRGHSGKAERSIKRAPFEPITARMPPAEGAIMTISRSHAAKELVDVRERD